MRHKLFILSTLILLVSMACSHLKNDNSDGQLLASAYGAQLYFNDVKDQLSPLHTKSDSQEIISNHIDNWLMDQILNAEARKNHIHKDRIDKLVNDYETSLYIHQYEEDYVSKYLNTHVDSAEINDYFLLHQEAFIPQEDIFRYFMITVHEEYDNDTLKTLWNTEDLPILKQFITEKEGMMVLDPSRWYSKHELKELIPDNLFNKIRFNKPNNYSGQEDDKKYFVKILEIAKANDTPPVSYYQDKVKELILRSRSQLLVKEMKNKIFKTQIQNKRIKIYGPPKN